MPEAIADAFLEQAITGTTSRDLNVWGQRFASIYGDRWSSRRRRTPRRDT
ncbi:MAG: hypothetical protein R2699_10515 [Acidimicrobiales bacterium]